jgi:hypothetical protein
LPGDAPACRCVTNVQLMSLVSLRGKPGGVFVSGVVWPGDYLELR